MNPHKKFKEQERFLAVQEAKQAPSITGAELDALLEMNGLSYVTEASEDD